LLRKLSRNSHISSTFTTEHTAALHCFAQSIVTKYKNTW